MEESRWMDLMARIGLNSSLHCFTSLKEAYSEKHRYYHTIQHIDAMLKHFDRIQDLADHPDEIELAIWFHDAIYKPFSKTNEQDSADWAFNFLKSGHYEKEGATRVYELIMATLHNRELKNNDQKLIVDIDLSILGTKPEVYEKFEKNVRKEYKLVPWFLYRKKRKEILQSFLDKKYIYHFGYFKERFESNARNNISLAIKSL
ncbi:MAG: hypothetical protein HWE27_05575 [Gammaproteobacteria bacterium]|nr:hypothetical protein [Gammaproteobacteria bacterium]